jgi:molybdopterin converting factor small subunit
MAEITVRLYSLFRQLAEADCFSFEADDLEEVIRDLEQKFGSRLREQLEALSFGKGMRLRDCCILLLNGRSVNKEELDRVKLCKGDTLHIFPLAAGG